MQEKDGKQQGGRDENSAPLNEAIRPLGFLAGGNGGGGQA